MRFYLALFAIVLFICCSNKENTIDVSHIVVNLEIDRFDQDFYNASSETLLETKNKYPMLFPHDIDSVWINKLNNKDERELFAETQKKYKNIDFLKEDLEQLFKHVIYYNPNFKIPRTIAMLTNIDYDNRVVLTDKYLFLSLDAYLGENHEFYNDFPDYIKQNNTADHIVVDVANAIIAKQIAPAVNRNFLRKMVAEGKKMYLLDSYLTFVPDHIKIGFSQQKHAWAMAAEEQVWKYFVSKDLLYSTDAKLNQRFLNIAPFSKFYLATDNDSPGRIGVYMGWQIVRSFMRNNDVSLQTLMHMDEEELFKKSKYKPRR